MLKLDTGEMKMETATARATTFEELERAFMELTQRHNALVQRVMQLERAAKPVLKEHTRYGL